MASSYTAFSVSNRPRRWLPWLTAIGVFLLGLFLVLALFRSLMQQEADHNVDQVLKVSELLVRQAQAAAGPALRMRNMPCDKLQPLLRNQATLDPYVRSINVSQDDGLTYCSSLPWLAPQQVQPGLANQGPIELEQGTDIAPDVPVLIYRERLGPHRVSVVVDARYLDLVFKLVPSVVPSYLRVGNAWLDQRGRLHQEPLPVFGMIQRERQSSQFPLQAVSGMAPGEGLHLLYTRYPLLLALLGLFGLCAAYLCHVMQRRPKALTHELERGLEGNEFEPFLQPLVGAGDGVWLGAEVLMRWRHPNAGLIEPNLFIPAAEDSGLIVPMTRMLIQKVARQLAGQDLPAGFQIGFNICACHLQDEQLYQDCQAFLGHFAPGSIRLVLELTERQLVEVTPQTTDLLQKLHALGVHIAIDDFGTGHSSLTYLQKLDVDELKIDQSFVAGIGTDSLSGHILESILQLAVKLELTIVAEGVETLAQQLYLEERGAHLLQGYRFAKPMPMTEFASRLQLRMNNRQVELAAA